MIKSKRTAVADGVMRSVRLAEHVDARVRQLAQSEGTTVSSILRRAIAEGVADCGCTARKQHEHRG